MHSSVQRGLPLDCNNETKHSFLRPRGPLARDFGLPSITSSRQGITSSLIFLVITSFLGDNLIPDDSLEASPHPSCLIPHPLCLISHLSSLNPFASSLIPCALSLNPHPLCLASSLIPCALPYLLSHVLIPWFLPLIQYISYEFQMSFKWVSNKYQLNF